MYLIKFKSSERTFAKLYVKSFFIGTKVSFILGRIMPSVLKQGSCYMIRTENEKLEQLLVFSVQIVNLLWISFLGRFHSNFLESIFGQGFQPLGKRLENSY